MTSKIIPFVLGLAVGAAVCALVLGKRPHPDTAPAPIATAVTVSNEIADLKSQLAAANSAMENANAEKDKLIARVRESMERENETVAAKEKKPRPNPFAAFFGGEGTNEMSEAMSNMMKTAMQQQIEDKLAGMKAKLNLTPEQEKSIRDIMGSQIEKSTEMAQKMFSGEMSKEELEMLGKDPGNEEEQIKALLTPEQFAAYGEYQKEENTRMARLTANSELMEMQPSLQLTEEQQDKVFAVLSEQALSEFDHPGDDANSLDFRAKSGRKTEALRGVLTPEQFERYQKFQEQQLKMMEAFMPKDTTNSDVHLHVTPIISR